MTTIKIFNPIKWGARTCNCSGWGLTKIQINKLNHIKNGNIFQNRPKIIKKLKILHLNKGSKFLTNSNELINDLIFKEDPDIFSLSECNINFNFDEKEIGPSYKNYNIELKKMTPCPKKARMALFIKKSITYTRLAKYEHELNSVIWIKINIKNKKPVYFGGGYRQWALPGEMGFKDSRSPKNQINRFSSLLNSWSLILKSKCDTIVSLDSNIDFYPLSKHHENYLDKKLYDMFQEFIADNKLKVHNSQFTRYASNCDPSVIDQIVSNCPQKLLAVKTDFNNISDHCHLSSTFNIEIPKQQPKYRKYRDFKLIYRESLLEALKINPKMQNVFHHSDPDKIATIIMDTLNEIIDTLAPLRIIPVRKDHIPYIDSETRKAIAMNKNQLTDAISSKNDKSKWRHFRKHRNKIFKNIAKKKSDYIKEKLAKPIDKWKFVKSLNSNQHSSSPSYINLNGYIFQSPKIISNIMNDYYVNKIKDIRAEFTKPPVDPIVILESLGTKPGSSFKLPFITPAQTEKIIKGQKNSSSTGYDAISNKILKKIAPEMAPVLTHLINCIIRTGIFPNCLKVSKIIPILKSESDPSNIANFRPVNCLPAVEKVVEEWLQTNLQFFFEQNGLINDNNHGGRKNFSTVTAKASIEDKIYKNFEDNMITGVLNCDLSSAFDLIDHKILGQKLKYYGIKGPELKLFESYLSNWQQFVEIDTFRSNIVKNLPCSCIQGSKLSGLLFTIYTCEIPLVQKIMKDPILYKAMTGTEPPNFKIPKHETDTYVDDSFNTIAFDSPPKIKTYLEKFYDLMHSYYNANMLKINPQKTKLMFVSKAKLRPATKFITFKAKGHEIKPMPSLKILGSYVSHDLSQEREISQLLPLLNHRINQFEKLKSFTDFNTRLQFSNSYILGRLQYMMPTYTTLNKSQKDRVHKILMRTARMTLNSYCFKKSIDYILGKCKWVDVDEMIKLSSLKFINNMLVTQKPGTLYSKVKINKRSCADLSFYVFPKSRELKSTLLYRGIRYFNQLPSDLKYLPSKQFKVKIKSVRHTLKQLSD